MPEPVVDRSVPLDRRAALRLGAVGLAGLALGRSAAGHGPRDAPGGTGGKGRPTTFQIACMTLPYAAFPLKRALTGLSKAGYRHVAWGTTHVEAGEKKVPVVAADAAPGAAREVGKKCRDLGLEPVLMFAGTTPDAENHLEVMTNRLHQAEAAGVPQVLAFGNTRGGDRKRWVEHFRQLGRVARDRGVLIVIKPHGGLTASGVKCREIVAEVADDGVKVNYDAGNVMDYLDIDAAATLADFRKCADEVRSFCVKDHRNWPSDEDCGPGFGEIDHYRLLHPVAFTGRTIPLCCENIFAPRLPRPDKPEEVDALAKRAREFLELVVGGVQR
jgi:sugar phosphate isomerase/epimerase